MFSRVRVRVCVCVVLAFLLSLLFAVFKPAPVSFGPMTLEEYFASLVPGLSDITIAWEKLEAAYAPSVLTVRYPDRHDPYGPIRVYITHPNEDLYDDELPIDEHGIDQCAIDTVPVLDTSIPSAIPSIDTLLVAAPVHIASVVLDTTIPSIIPAIDASLIAPRPGALPRPSYGPSSTVLLVISFIVLAFSTVLAGTLFVRRAMATTTRRPSACTQSELGQSPSQLEPHTVEEYVHDSTIPTCKLPLPVAELAQSPRRATPLESPAADGPAHESTTPTTPTRGLPLLAPERALAQSPPRATQDKVPAADAPAHESTTPTQGGHTPARSHMRTRTRTASDELGEVVPESPAFAGAQSLPSSPLRSSRALCPDSPLVKQRATASPATEECPRESTTPTPGGGTPTRYRVRTRTRTAPGKERALVPASPMPARVQTITSSPIAPRAPSPPPMTPSPRAPLVMHPRPAVFEPGFQFYATPLPTSRTAAAPPAVYSPPLAVVRSYNEIYSTPRPAPASSASPIPRAPALNVLDLDDVDAQFNA
ncbi:hypothetical protein C8R44DRAFT_67505 [Mycena epipterygia]|nr:hypothetical protein C8R44DRAFT_67505 [Mycena epipterygia]